MTSSNGQDSDRLDRIERLLESVAQRTDSNARTIQGILDARATERLEHEEKMAVMTDAIQRLIRIEEAQHGDWVCGGNLRTPRRQNRMLAGIDENQPTILRKLTTIGSATARSAIEKQPVELASRRQTTI